jgi:DNA-binding transcriptional LysR family regulator
MTSDLVWVRAFVAVAEELHFGHAALRLGISQPQVSRHVRALEDALSVELFVRTARRTELSDAGAALLEDARDVLAAADRLRANAEGQRRGTRGHVSVAFLWSTLGGYLPPLVAAAASHHPEIELTVSQTTYLQLIPALRRGSIDLAITRALYEPSEMVEIELQPEPAVVAVPDRHRFSELEEVALEALSGEPLISLSRKLIPQAYDTTLERARELGIDLNIVREVSSPSEALALVSAGIGIYRLPASAALPFPGVTFRRLGGTQSRLVLMHRPFPRPSVARIAELVLQQFGDAGSASKNALSDLDVDRITA